MVIIYMATKFDAEPVFLHIPSKTPQSRQLESYLLNATICVICYDVLSGETATSVSPPHPVWTDSRGIAVTQLNAIALGGMNGLNS